MISRSLLAVSCLSAFSSFHEALHVHLGTSAAAAPREGRSQLRQAMGQLRSRSSFTSTKNASLPWGSSFRALYPRAAPALQLQASDGSTSTTTNSYAMDTLHFDFHGLPTAPSYMDFKTVLCQMDYFYTDFLQEGRPEDSFTDVKLEVIDWYFDGKEDFPASISFIANATDETGSYLDPNEMNEKLASRSFFLRKFAQEAWPEEGNQFHDTKHVTLETEVWTDEQLEDVDFKFSSSRCPERGSFLANVSYGFFDGKANEPTQQEVDDLEQLTSAFMSQVLQEEVTNVGVDIEFTVADWLYTEGGVFPLYISFQVRGFFDDKAEIPLDVLEYHLGKRSADGGQLMQDYIKQAVWKTPPLEQSAFYSVNKAKMESKVHLLTTEELKSSTIFSDSLEDDPTDPVDPGDMPEDLTNMTLSPTPMLSPAASPSGAADATSNGSASPGSSSNGRPGSIGSPAGTATDDSDGSDATTSGGGSGGGPSINIPSNSHSNSNPSANDPTQSGQTVSNSNLPSRPGGSPLGSLGALGDLIPGGVLRPVTATEEQCEVVLIESDANADDHVDKAEFVEFINRLTQVSFPYHTFEAIPNKVKECYDAFATQDAPAGGYIIPIVKLGVSNPIDRIVEDAVRKNIICRAIKTAIKEAEAEQPTRGEAVLAFATIQFMASCQGDNCGVESDARRRGLASSDSSESGLESLQEAFRNFLQTDIGPIFDAQHKGGAGQPSSYLAPETGNITAMEETDCPRHAEDPGDDKVKCYLATADFKVFCEGTDLEQAEEAVAEAEQITLLGIDAGLLKESLNLMSVKGTDSPWVVYKNLDVVLSMHPSSSPTLSPSLKPPTSAPTGFRRNIPLPLITQAPTKNPTSSPTSEPPEATSFVPSEAPTQAPESSFWAKAFDMEGAGLGLAAGASIGIMIVLQCFRELLVDIVIKICKCMFCWRRGNGEDEDNSESDRSEKSDDDDDELDKNDTKGKG